MTNTIFINKRKVKILVSAAGGACVSLIILLFLSFGYHEGVNNQLPTSGTGYFENLPENSSAYKQRAFQIDQKNQVQMSQDSLLGLFLTKLPHQGVTFTLYYNFQTNQFIVQRVSGSPEAFSTEFDSFLAANHIKSRNWLYNLSIN